jgi:hypothetical protein
MSPDLRERLIAVLEWALQDPRGSQFGREVRECLEALRADRPGLVPAKASKCGPECVGHTDGKFCA